MEIIAGLISLMTVILTILLSISKIYQSKLKIEETKKENLLKKIMEEMEEVEKNSNYKSEEKLQKVIEEIKKYKEEQSLKMEDEKIIEQIKRLIELTKKINQK